MRIEKTVLASAAVVLMSWFLATSAHAGSLSGFKARSHVNVEGAIHKVGFRGRRGFHHRRFGHSRFHFGRRFHGGFRGVFRSGR